MSGLGLTFLRRGGQAHPTAGSDYIKFKDEAVFNILMSKGVSSDGVGITKDDALKVTSIASWFRDNATIQTFEELVYFRNVTNLETRAFSKCTNLKKIDLTWIETMGGSVFEYCPLEYEEFATPNMRTLGLNAFPDAFIQHYVDMGNIVELPTQNFSHYGRKDTLQSINLPVAVKVLPTQNFFGYVVLNSINTSHIEDFGASSLRNTGLSSIDLSSAKYLRTYALYDSPIKMSEISMPNLELFEGNCFSGKAEILHFRDLGKITNVPNGGTAWSNYGKKSITQSIVFPATVTSIAVYFIYGYTALKALTFLSATPPTITDSRTWDQSSSCPIYVPDASVDAYKTATNWTQVANRIKPLSEYNG